MDAGGWLVAVLASAAALVGGGFVLRRLWLDHQRVAVPGFTDVFCEGLDPDAVSRHLGLAIDCLAAVWPEQQGIMRRALSGWTVVGMGAIPYARNGQMVAGFLDGWNLRLEVLDDMDGLAHEVAHLYERLLTGRTDESHVSWTPRGLFAAISDYQRKRKELLA